MEKKTFIKTLKICGSKTKIAFVAGLALLAVVAVVVFVFSPSGKTIISVKSSLKEILENSDLLTAEYTYNSIAKVRMDESKPAEDDNIKYQVYYKGAVKSGFNIEKIDVVEKEKSIVVIVPKIEIKDVIINPDFDYIFTKEKYDTENTYSEAYNACCKDLEDKAKESNTLQRTAVESAIETISAITKPFEKHLDEGETIQVVYIDDYTLEVEQ